MRPTLAGLAGALALAACSRSPPPPAVEPTTQAAAVAPDADGHDQPSAAPVTAASARAGAEAETDEPSQAASQVPPLALVPPVGPDSGASSSAEPDPPTNPKPPNAPAIEESFAPRDECVPLAGWSAFREKLGAAIGKRDAAALAALADPAVKLDFGGGSGTVELRKRLRQPAGVLWKDLAALMPLGCSVEGGIAAIPWFFWRIPPRVDPAASMLVTGGAVTLRSAPRTTAAVVAKLDWPIVVLADAGFDPGRRFTHVRTRASGQEGYVETGRLRSLLARRIVVERQGDDWKITAIVAGD